MATFKAEIQNKRADGTYNVRIRVTHNRIVRRLSTNIYVTSQDLTRSGKIKNAKVIDQCEGLIAKCRNVCNDLGFEINKIEIDALLDKLKTKLDGGDKFRLDFIAYTKKKAESMNPGTGGIYKNMLSALQRYIKRDSLDISEINTAFLQGFEAFIGNEPSMRGNNRKKATEEVEKKGSRAVSLYLSCVRAIHNKAKEEFNDEDRGIINIPYSPFKNFKIKPQPKTRKRALSVEMIQQIINLPYKEEIVGGRTNRYNLAKDCFILSFALVGMNSADMYNSELPKKGIITYKRQKTRTRREDEAEMQIRIENVISNLMKRYNDDQQLFRFYRHYIDKEGFNKAINKGLKQIGKDIGVEDLEFYAARHSWATIARSSAVGIDKYTVHEGLNHAPDKDMKVTDIYIDRDWSTIWDANKKVLSLFEWSAIQ